MQTFYTYKTPNVLAVSEYIQQQAVHFIAFITPNFIEVMQCQKVNDYRVLIRMYDKVFPNNVYMTLVQTFNDHYEIAYITEQKRQYV
jgi:hypothetical protein